jgi:hypothetical protein
MTIRRVCITCSVFETNLPSISRRVVPQTSLLLTMDSATCVAQGTMFNLSPRDDHESSPLSNPRYGKIRPTLCVRDNDRQGPSARLADDGEVQMELLSVYAVCWPLLYSTYVGGMHTCASTIS